MCDKNESNKNQDTTESYYWQTEARELLTAYNTKFCLWKSFLKSQEVEIKSYLGLNLFGIQRKFQNFRPDTCYNHYNTSQKKIIDNIFKQLKFDKTDDGEYCIQLAHTYLYLSFNNILLCLFRQRNSKGDATFIDINGRVYRNWTHFIETNELPCEFMAPDDGNCKVKGKLHVYKPPSQKFSSKLLQAGDIAASGLAITAVGLGVIAVAPVAACAMGVTGIVYGSGRNIGRLIDRKEHQQSIGLDNLESTMIWLSIGTTVIYGISSLTFANSTRIIAMTSAEYNSLAVTALKGLNYVSLASNVLHFGACLFYYRNKWINGELTSREVMGLCVSVFLIYGAVVNYNQMRLYLTQLEVNSQPIISNTMKEEIRQAFAELTENVTSKNATDCNKCWLICGGSIFGIVAMTILERYYPVTYRVFCICRGIIESITRYRQNRLTTKTFVENMSNHFLNLCELLRENFGEFRENVSLYFQRYFGAEPPAALADEVIGIIDNGVVSLNSTMEDIPLVDQDHDNFDSNLQMPNDDRTKYEIILDIVKLRVYQNNCSFENLLSIFIEQLNYVIDKITGEPEKDFEKILSHISSKLDKDTFGKNIRNSTFHFVNRRFTETIENLSKEFPDDFQSGGCNAKIESAIDKLIAYFKKLFLSLAREKDENILTVSEICHIFRKSVSTVFEPLNETLKCAKKLYQKNHHRKNTLSTDSFKGQQSDDLGIFETALNALNSVNIVYQLSSVINFEKEIFPPAYSMETLVSLSGNCLQKIYQKLETTNTEMCSEQIKNFYFFIVQTFNDEFHALKNEQYDMPNISKALTPLQSQFNEIDFIRIRRILDETIRREIFDRIVEKFNDEEYVSGLKARYSAREHSVQETHGYVELWRNVLGEDGLKIHSIDVKGCSSDNDFKVLTARVFNLRESNIEIVNRTSELVIFRSNNKYITFKLVENKNHALVMQCDASIGERNFT